MKNKKENLLTLQEIAEILRVSKHTVQAWISPSSPNHRPEFAAMARHAGRKTVFLENEVYSWLNQRRGPVYSLGSVERSAYWRERFVSGRGIYKGLIKTTETEVSFFSFQGGLLGIDTAPLICWLTDGKGASAIYNLVLRAEGLVLPLPLAFWLLRRAKKIPGRFKQMQNFVFDENIFEIAVFNEEAALRGIDFSSSINELSLKNYCSALNAGCSSFLTGDKNLLKIPGLALISFI